MMTVLITGASSGIGAGTAKSFAADGHLVIACGRDASRPAALQQLSPNISVRLFDMTDRDACRRADRLFCRPDHSLRRDLRIPRPRTGGCRPRGAGDGHQLPRAGELLAALQTQLEAGDRVVLVSSMAHWLPFPRAEAYGASRRR